jgi:predicted nuclease of predicted toxin-antitoxin system
MTPNTSSRVGSTCSTTGLFLYLSSQPHDAGRFLWVRLGNCRNDDLLAAFSVSFDRIVGAFDSGQTVVELI